MGKNRTQSSKGKEKRGLENQSAAEIAEIMAASMTANMKNPKFLEEQDIIGDKVRRKIIKERDERKKGQKQNQEDIIPPSYGTANCSSLRDSP